MQQSCDVNEKNQEIGILTNNSYACKTKQNIKSLDWNVSMISWMHISTVYFVKLLSS